MRMHVCISYLGAIHRDRKKVNTTFKQFIHFARKTEFIRHAMQNMNCEDSANDDGMQTENNQLIFIK